MRNTLSAKLSRLGLKFNTQGLDSQLLYLIHSQTDEPIAESHYQWLRTSAQLTGGFPAEGQGNLSQAAQVLDKKHPITLVLPTHRGLLTQVDIPSKRNKQIRNALPFLLQKRLLEDASQFYFAWLAKGKKAQTSKQKALTVAGYPQVELHNLLNECKAQGLKIGQVVLDAQLLPTDTPHTWTLLADGQYWLLNYGEGQCCSIDHEKFFDVVLAQALEPVRLLASDLDGEKFLDDGLLENEEQEGEASDSEDHTEVAQPLRINVLGQSAQEAVIKLHDKGFPASAIHTVPASIYQSRIKLLYEADASGYISLLPKQYLGKTKQTFYKLSNFCQGQGRSVMLWSSYCILALLTILTLHNQQLEQDIFRAKNTYAKIAKPLEAQLNRSPIPQTLSARVDSLKTLHPSNSNAFILLDIWGNIKSYLSNQVSPSAWAANSMQYDANQLLVTWQVDTVEQAIAEGNALDKGAWLGSEKVNIEWRYTNAEGAPAQLITLNITLLETAL